MWKNVLAIASQIQLGNGPLRMGIMYVGGDNKPNHSGRSVAFLTLVAGGVPGATIVSFN
jgi:hypothetical protein